jgi:hypothetical protein
MCCIATATKQIITSATLDTERLRITWTILNGTVGNDMGEIIRAPNLMQLL